MTHAMRAYQYEVDKPYGTWEMDRIRQAMGLTRDSDAALCITPEVEQIVEPLRRDSGLDTKRRFAPVSLAQLRKELSTNDATEMHHEELPLDWSNGVAPGMVSVETLHETEDPHDYHINGPFNANPCFTERNTSGVYFSRWVQYKEDHYYCNGTEISKERWEREHLWNHNCTDTHKNLNVCFCAQDRLGSRCNQVIKMDCAYSLETTVDCLSPPGIGSQEQVVGGVPVSTSGHNCLRYKQHDHAHLDFKMKCSTTYGTSMAANRFPRDVTFKDLETGEIFHNWAAVMGNFSYFIHSGDRVDGVYDFAMSEEVWTPLFLAPVNFFHFIDTSGRQDIELRAPGHYVGRDRFSFDVDLSTLDEEYFAGNRLYFELGYPTNHPIVRPKMLRFYIDIPERTIPDYSNLSEILVPVLVPVGVLLVLAVVGLYVLYRFIKRRRRQQFFKVKDVDENVDLIEKVR